MNRRQQLWAWIALCTLLVAWFVVALIGKIIMTNISQGYRGWTIIIHPLLVPGVIIIFVARRIVLVMSKKK